MTMRNAIKARLMSEIPLCNHLQADIATAQTSKPFTTIRKSNETQGNINVAYDLFFNIFCNVEKGDYNSLDTLVQNVITALNNVELVTSGSKRFKLRYNGFIGSEFYDQDFDCYSQGLQFSTINII